MKPERKKGLLIVIGAAVLIVFVSVVALLRFDINSYKTKIETIVSETLGLDVRIMGEMGLSFFPFGVSARDIHVANKGNEVLSLERLTIRAELMPLVNKQLRVKGCDLVKPAVVIVKDLKGRHSFQSDEGTSPKVRPGKAFGLHDLKVSNGSLIYFNKKTAAKTELKGISLAIRDIMIADASGSVIKNISFSGAVECKELRAKDLKIDNMKGQIKGAQGVFYVSPLTMEIFGAKSEGDVTADQSESDAKYKINLTASKLNFEKLQESFGVKRLISGKGDLVASLTVEEKGGRSLMSGTNGAVSLMGRDLVTHTVDLDKVLSAYQKSQRFNLVDVGAFFIAGPFGAAALKGYRYGDVYYQAQGGRGSITNLASRWNIKNGQAEATDCAFATRHHRVALQGRLDLARERYDNVTVALLDDKGCATLKQSIGGPFDAPQVGALSAVQSLAEPILHLFRKAKGLVQGGSCEVFYSGSVQHPR